MLSKSTTREKFAFYPRCSCCYYYYYVSYRNREVERERERHFFEFGSVELVDESMPVCFPPARLVHPASSHITVYKSQETKDERISSCCSHSSVDFKARGLTLALPVGHERNYAIGIHAFQLSFSREQPKDKDSKKRKKQQAHTTPFSFGRLFSTTLNSYETGNGRAESAMG